MSILEHASLMTDEIRRVPLEELQTRLARFREEMEKEHPGWQMAVINNKVNMYYFTGTMQEGALVIRPQDEILWVRRSYDRARNRVAAAGYPPNEKLSHFGGVLRHLPGSYVCGMQKSHC